MADNLGVNGPGDGTSYPNVALNVVRRTIVTNLEKTDPVPDFDVYIVWFCYILGGWKALVSSTLPDGRYYEVTHKAEHDGSDGPAKTFVDTYVKVANLEFDMQEVPD